MVNGEEGKRGVEEVEELRNSERNLNSVVNVLVLGKDLKQFPVLFRVY